MELYGEFPEKAFYYCNPSNYHLRSLPPLSKEYEDTAKVLTTRFTGDASFFAYNGEDPEEPDAGFVYHEEFKRSIINLLNAMSVFQQYA